MYTCVYIYIYLQAQQNRYLGSWFILRDLKVEHLNTHVERYGVDYKKKGKSNVSTSGEKGTKHHPCQVCLLDRAPDFNFSH